MEWVEVTAKTVEEAKERRSTSSASTRATPSSRCWRSPRPGCSAGCGRRRGSGPGWHRRRSGPRSSGGIASAGGRRDRPAQASGAATVSAGSRGCRAGDGVRHRLGRRGVVRRPVGGGATGPRAGIGARRRLVRAGPPASGAGAGGTTIETGAAREKPCNEGTPTATPARWARSSLSGLLAPFGVKFELERRDSTRTPWSWR